MLKMSGIPQKNSEARISPCLLPQSICSDCQHHRQIITGKWHQKKLLTWVVHPWLQQLNSLCSQGGNNNNPQKLPLYLSSRLLSQTSENSRCYQKSNLCLSTLTLPIKLTFTNEPLKFCLNSIPREDVQYPYSLQVFEHPPQLCLTSCFVLFLSKVQLYC